jgi:hypothetical protein
MNGGMLRMNAILVSTFMIVALAGYFGEVGRNSEAAAQAATDAETQAVVSATNAFLNSLSADQRQKEQFSFTPQKTARENQAGQGDKRW